MLLSDLFVTLLSVLSLAFGVRVLTPAWGFLYSGAVVALAVFYLVARMVERREEREAQDKRDAVLDGIMAKVTSLTEKAERLPAADPLRQEIFQVAESVASSVAQMYAHRQNTLIAAAIAQTPAGWPRDYSGGPND